MRTRLRTPLCAKLGVDLPILVAPFGPWDEVELAVAAASSGCLASLGTAVRSVAELEQQWATLRARTDRPFVINHTGRPFNPEAFAATLDVKPAAISFHVVAAGGIAAGAQHADRAAPAWVCADFSRSGVSAGPGAGRGRTRRG